MNPALFIRIKISFGLLILLIAANLNSSAYSQTDNNTQAPPKNNESPTREAVGAAFNFEMVKQKAKSLSHQRFDPDAQNSNPVLEQLSYDDYRKVRFNRQVNILNQEGNFRIEVQPTGFLFKKTVKISIIQPSGEVLPINGQEGFDAKKFFDTEEVAPEIAPALDLSGFKVLFPLHGNSVRDETIVFQGASYFRPLAANQQFGSSARGLAVDTASPRGEEFPYFREFWIKKPLESATSLRVYALMDSNRLTGAYSFIITPSATTKVEVEAHLYPRSTIDKVGIAPLTSMFIFGEMPHPKFNDYRLEVHDSDGLLMATGRQEWIWRPLENPFPLGVRVTQYLDENPAGFGLMQRDNSYHNYLDLEARYDRRPSLWVTPLDGWGKGKVELVEISTAEETVDNIVAYWVPEKRLQVGKSTMFRYMVAAENSAKTHHPFGRAVRIRSGAYHEPGKPLDDQNGEKIFSIDFVGGVLSELEEDEVQGFVSSSKGEIRGVRVQKDPIIQGMRLWFRLKPEEGDTDLRLGLKKGKEQISETVIYLYTGSN